MEQQCLNQSVNQSVTFYTGLCKQDHYKVHHSANSRTEQIDMSSQVMNNVHLCSYIFINTI